MQVLLSLSMLMQGWSAGTGLYDRLYNSFGYLRTGDARFGNHQV